MYVNVNESQIKKKYKIIIKNPIHLSLLFSQRPFFQNIKILFKREKLNRSTHEKVEKKSDFLFVN